MIICKVSLNIFSTFVYTFHHTKLTIMKNCKNEQTFYPLLSKDIITSMLLVDGQEQATNLWKGQVCGGSCCGEPQAELLSRSSCGMICVL